MAPDRDSRPGRDQTPDSGSPPCLVVGQSFDPWRKTCGFYAPDIVGRQRNLTDGQKRLYERSVRWAGQNGNFWYSFETIAEALGKSVRQVKDDMAALEAKGLLKHVRRRRQSNLYFFLWHSMFEVQHTALQEENLEVQDSSLEVQDRAILEVQSTAREFSPLESRPMNRVRKADAKLIPGNASQKQRSAASDRAPCTGADARPAEPKTDPAAVSAHDCRIAEAADPANAWTPSELAEVRRSITRLWGQEPEPGLEVSIMLRARGTSAADVCELFDRKHAKSNCRVGGRWAPRSQNWFFAVIENEFTSGHLPEAPAMPRREHQIEPEDLARGIDALDLVEAPPAVMEPVRCDARGHDVHVNDAIGDSQCAGEPGAPSQIETDAPSDSEGDGEDGYSKIQGLLMEYAVTVRPGQVREILTAGRGRGLTPQGTFAFVRDKLREKRAKNDPVYSAALLIKAIGDRTDLLRWASTHSCDSFFERVRGRPQASSTTYRSTEVKAPPFSVEGLRAHLSHGARQLRAIPGYEEIAAKLDQLNADSECHYRDLEELEQQLRDLEEEMRAVALSRQSSDDVLEIRRETNSHLDRYREKMSQEQVCMLERQHLSRRLFERAGLPRLSLFYLGDHAEIAA
jgi:hypothetical protein